MRMDSRGRETGREFQFLALREMWSLFPLHNTRIIIIKGVFAGSLAVLVLVVFISLAHDG